MTGYCKLGRIKNDESFFVNKDFSDLQVNNWVTTFKKAEIKSVYNTDVYLRNSNKALFQAMKIIARTE